MVSVTTAQLCCCSDSAHIIYILPVAAFETIWTATPKISIWPVTEFAKLVLYYEYLSSQSIPFLTTLFNDCILLSFHQRFQSSSTEAIRFPGKTSWELSLPGEAPF